LWELEATDGLSTWWTPQDYRHELGNPLCRQFFLPGESLTGPLNGFVLYRELLDEGWIMQLAVRHKGVGWGRRLLQAFLDGVRDKSIRGPDLPWRRVLLEVSEQNEAARRLYRACGFRQVGFRKAYYRNGDSALVMEWVPDATTR
jgi:ribosomal protein S18 acetylase RimI-like enzyme